MILSLLALATAVAASPSISSHILPVNPGGIGGLFKGPNSEILIKGPDGSVITAANEGGEVHTGLAEAPIVAAEPSVVAVSTASPLAVSNLQLSGPDYSGSGYLLSPPLVATSRIAVAPPLVSPVIETVAVAAPAVEPEQSSDVHGSSGRILTKGSKSIIAGPASTTIADGHAVVEAPAVASTVAVAPAVGPILAASPVAAVASPTVATATLLSLPHSAVTAAPIIASTPGVQLGSSILPPLGVSVESLPVGYLGSNAGRVPLGLTAEGIPLGFAVEGIPLGPPVRGVALGSPAGSVDLGSTTGGIALGSPAGGVALGSTAAPTQSLGNLPLGYDLGPSIPQTESNGFQTATPGSLGAATYAPESRLSVGPQSSTTFNTLNRVATPTLSPQIQASSTPTTRLFTPATPAQGPVINGIPASINGKIDLGPQIQLAGQLNQLTLDPALIPSANIIPPEIGIGALSPVSSTVAPILASSLAPGFAPSPRAPGLAAATTVPVSGIQRSEIDATVRVPLAVSTASPLEIRNDLLIPQNRGLQDHRLQDVSIQDPRLQGVNVQDPSLQGVNIQDPRLQNVNFHDPSLQGINLQDARLQGVNLQDPRLQSVNLQDPSLQGVNLQDARLQGVHLQDPRLQSVNLQDRSLQGVSLQDPRLGNVNLQDPSLQPVNLQGINLQDARLQGVNLQDPRLQGSIQDPRLQDPRLQGAVLQVPSGLASRLTVPSSLGGVVAVQPQIQPAPVQELVNVTPRGNGAVLDGRLSLASVQQQDILSAELAKSGIDAAEVQLTSVPLSSISRVVNPIVDSRGDLRGFPRSQAWNNRWGRETKKEQQ